MPKNIVNIKDYYQPHRSFKDYCADEKPITPNHKLHDDDDDCTSDFHIIIGGIVCLVLVAVGVCAYLACGVKP